MAIYTRLIAVECGLRPSLRTGVVCEYRRETIAMEKWKPQQLSELDFAEYRSYHLSTHARKRLVKVGQTTRCRRSR